MSALWKVVCGVFNIDLDEYNKLSMKRELFFAALPILRIAPSARGFCNQGVFL